MGTDRDASGEGEQPLPGSPSAHSPSPSSPAPAPPAEDPAHGYDYGHEPLAAGDDDGLHAEDPGTGIPSPDASASTRIDPVTGMRTAPRAVLRPVPEGFPTPPPRPARPNRRPAPKPEPVPSGTPHRALLITGIAIVAVLLLALGVGGSVLAYRALSPAADAPATEEDSASPGPAAPGQVEIGGVTLTEVGTETGVRSVGGHSDSLEPEGEFVVVVFEIVNDSDAPIMISSSVALETAEGEEHLPDSEAALVHVASSLPYGVVSPGTTGVFHMVYDVPIGTDPTGLTFQFAALDESGTLPVNA